MAKIKVSVTEDLQGVAWTELHTEAHEKFLAGIEPQIEKPKKKGGEG